MPFINTWPLTSMEHPTRLTAISALLPGNVLSSAWAEDAQIVAMIEKLIAK
jgi:hypothetical protein